MDANKRSLAYPKSRRVRKRAEFIQIQQSSKRAGSVHFLLLYREARSAVTGTRFGITVSKKVDKRAVVRNLLRRRVKEFLRLEQHSVVAGVEMVIIVKPGAVDLSFSLIAKELKELLRRVKLYRS